MLTDLRKITSFSTTRNIDTLQCVLHFILLVLTVQYTMIFNECRCAKFSFLSDKEDEFFSKIHTTAASFCKFIPSLNSHI